VGQGHLSLYSSWR